MKVRLFIMAGCLSLLTGCTALDNKCNYLPSNRCCPIAYYNQPHCNQWSCGYYYNFHDE